MKYGDISLVLCISTRLRLVTILSLLVKYLVILHADPCNKSYVSESAVVGECGSTLYVGLSGIVRNLIQKSTGWDHTFLSIFFFFFFLRDEQGWRQY